MPSVGAVLLHEELQPILFVAGTRPEAIKVVPVYLEFKRRGRTVKLCATMQHAQMLTDTLATFDVEPDIILDVAYESGSLADLLAQLTTSFDQVLERERPAAVVVQGDTATTFIASLLAFYRRIPVAHVEAGLRTYDMDAPFPEEFHRQAVTRYARWHFAPTDRAARNLLREGVAHEKIFVTGNTGIDAFLYMKKRIEKGEILPRADLSEFIDQALQDKKLVMLLTAHRRESFGAPMRTIFREVKDFVLAHEHIRLIYPRHKNPEVTRALEAVGFIDAQGVLAPELSKQVFCTGPLNYPDLIYALTRSDLVLTDSGGIQEEATSIGRPVLCLRDTTERTESLEHGNQMLAGTQAHEIRDFMLRYAGVSCEKWTSTPSAVYGDGTASRRIFNAMMGHSDHNDEGYSVPVSQSGGVSRNGQEHGC